MNHSHQYTQYLVEELCLLSSCLGLVESEHLGKRAGISQLEAQWIESENFLLAILGTLCANQMLWQTEREKKKIENKRKGWPKSGTTEEKACVVT